MLRIAHLSDLHIRNFKYHAEYRETFENVYRQLRELKPDLVINTGDTAHSKLQISPELVQMVAEHFEQVVQIAPYVVMLGNHDLNLHNLGRVDAISPIAAQFERVHLLKTCEPFDFSNSRTAVTLWPFAMADSEHYPNARTIREYEPDVDDPVNIGLFHGSVAGCVTDSEWTMAEAETELRLFDGFDYVLMGDIHKQQFFKGRRIAYAGSLIQQNFGESHDKGFLVWDIEDRNNFEVRHVPVQSPLKFRTLHATDDLLVPVSQTTSRGAYVRVFVPRAISAVEQRTLVSEVKRDFAAKEVICVLSPEAQDAKDRPVVDMSEDDLTNVRDLATQERMLRQFLEERGTDDETIQRVVELNRKVHENLDEDELARNSRWRLSKIGWSNLFSYGEGNIIDFASLPGVTGIFGPNGTGKSSIFDVINEGLFDKVTKDVSKNIELVNDNREEAKVVSHVTVDHRDYIIERTISRIKYGQKKKDVREWGRTDVDFYVVEDGEKTSLNGQSRPETEKAIRRVLGSFEDFCLTSFCPQNSIVGLPGGGDIISCKETDRKKILYRVLDLDLFERKAQAVKEISKATHSAVRGVDRESIVQEIVRYQQSLFTDLPGRIQEWKDQLREDQESLERGLIEQAQLKQEHDSIHAPAKASHRDTGLISEEIGFCDAEVRKISSTLDEMGDGPSWEGPVPEDLSQELRDAEFELRGRENAFEANEALKTQGKWKLKVLDDVPCGEQFPSCKFLIDAFMAKESLPQLSEREPVLQGNVQAVSQEVLSLRDKQGRWNAYQAHRKQALQHGESRLRLSQRIETATKTRETLARELERAQAYAAARSVVDRKADLAFRVAGRVAAIKKLRQSIAVAQKEVDALNLSAGSLRACLDDAEKSLKKFDQQAVEAHVCELYVEAFGKNGIPRLILAKALPLVNAEINRILANAVDFTVSLDHDDVEQSVGLYLQYGQYKRRNISLAGGAERFVASIAIRAALLSISSLPRTNMFIIDEGFGKLDPTMLDSIQRMFDYLRTCFDHVLIVSHLDSMRDVIDNVIEIGSDSDRYAHVEAI